MTSATNLLCVGLALGALAGCGSPSSDETPIDAQTEALDRARAVEDQLLERAERLGDPAGDKPSGEDEDDGRR